MIKQYFAKRKANKLNQERFKRAGTMLNQLISNGQSDSGAGWTGTFLTLQSKVKHTIKLESVVHHGLANIERIYYGTNPRKLVYLNEHLIFGKDVTFFEYGEWYDLLEAYLKK